MTATLMEIINDSTHPVWQRVYRFVSEYEIYAAFGGERRCPHCSPIAPGFRLVRGQWRRCRCNKERS